MGRLGRRTLGGVTAASTSARSLLEAIGGVVPLVAGPLRGDEQVALGRDPARRRRE